MTYLASLRSEGERCGAVLIVPPPGWNPAFSLPNQQTLRFATQVQVSFLGDAKSSRWVTPRARWVTPRARWVTLGARWVTLRARSIPPARKSLKPCVRPVLAQSWDSGR